MATALALPLTLPRTFDNRTQLKIEHAATELDRRLLARELADAPVLATGLDPLDRCLPGGGLPHGVTEVIGGCASGKLTLAFALLARALERGERAALIDPEATAIPDVWRWPALERLLVVRGGGIRSALSAADALLKTGAFALVVLDLPGLAQDRSGPRPRTPPAGAFLRLAHTARAAHTPMVLVSERLPWRTSGLAATAALRLEVAPEASSSWAGLDRLSVAIARSRRGGEGERHLLDLNRAGTEAAAAEAA